MARGRTKAVALKRLKDKKLEYERSGRMPSQTTPYLKDWLDRWLDEIVNRVCVLRRWRHTGALSRR